MSENGPQVFSARAKRLRRDRRARRKAELDAKAASRIQDSSNPNTEVIMASEKQIAANRANAQKSTGPRTGAGKAVARYNALTHGLTAARIVIFGEDEKEFEAFQAGIFAELRPTTPLQAETAAQIVATLWRLRRVPDLERAIAARNFYNLGLGKYDGGLMDAEDLGRAEVQRQIPTLSENSLLAVRKQGEMLARHGLDVMIRVLGYENNLTRLLDRLMKRFEKLKSVEVAADDFEVLESVDGGVEDGMAMNAETDGDKTVN
jgi:hypothetical protein